MREYRNRNMRARGNWKMNARQEQYEEFFFRLLFPLFLLFMGAVSSSHMYWLVSQRVRGVVDTELHHKNVEKLRNPKKSLFFKIVDKHFSYGKKNLLFKD
jgi:hypothetical protein